MMGKSIHFSFSFVFFVHGESTVCASIDVRRHPLVRKLSRQHLLGAQASTSETKVLLAPFGLVGLLSGQSYKALDLQTQRLLEDWRHFYPIPGREAEEEDLPPVVEVMVGGVKMRYPTCYVLVTDMDAPDKQGPPSSPSKARQGLGPPPLPAHLSEFVWQDSSLNPSQHEASEGDSSANQQPPPGHWEFVDPTRKAPCSCSKLVGLSTPSGGSSYPRGQSMTPNPLPTLHGGLNDSLPVPSVGSPASGGPSPLPHSHSQPASVPPADATMPTLSPHPPTSATPLEAQDKVTPAATPSDINGPKSVSSISNQVFSPYPAASSVEAATKPVDSVGGSQGPASAHSAPPPHPPTLPEFPSLKRPVLSSKEYESVLMEEEQPSQLLYDYSTLDAWLNYPVKRLKQSEPSKSPASSRRASADVYTPGHASSPTPLQAIVKQEVTIKQEPGCMMQNDNAHQKNDPYVFDDLAAPAVSMEGFKLKRNNSIKEEDRRNSSTSVLPPFDPIMANGPITKATSGNLFTNEGLQASYKDLDQIFDNSDDTSSDETLQVATPPDSNNPPGIHEDSAVTTVVTVKPPRSSGGNTSGTGTLRQEELSKMFPTPPSMEHNPGASPCGHMSDGPSGEPGDMAGSVRVRQDIYPNLGSPQEENIEDWSFVFRPPVICRMVGSSKYAPLSNLSKDLPPVILPPNCVYKPSWQYPPTQSHTDKSSQAAGHVSGSVPGTNSRPNSVASNHTHQVAMPHPPHPHHPILPHPRAGLSPISPASHFPTSPMALAGAGLSLHLQQFRGGGPGSVGSARTPCPPPPAYELSSPATSTASSYLNKNINSVEPEPAPAMARAPEASSLVVNILLADTALNIFRDHNFDSCNMCVCNAGPKVIGNIQGADAAIYLPVSQVQPSVSMTFPPTSPFPGMGMNGPPPPYGMMGSSPAHHRGPIMEEEINCTCGFSAVVNRRHSHRTGLFYEDEVEITGLAEDPSSRRKGSLAAYLLPNGMKNGQESTSEPVDVLPQNVIDLLREQCVIVQSPTNSLYRASRCFRAGFGPSGIPYSTTINMLDYSDGNEVTFLALEQGRQALLESTMVAMCKVEEMHQRQQMMQHGSKGQEKPCVHMWPYLRAKGPRCSQDIVRVMKNLQPLLQDAIQKKCTTRLWEAPYTVSGPLTWRQFHRLAGRGTDDRCEPQPIPSLMVGHDKDWLCLSPYAIHYWEKLLLEPYSYSRDVAYIVVAPENDYVLQKVRTFFRELSAAYEVCRLGRHSPITKVLREGILRVGKSAASKLAKEPVDDWFNMLGDNPTTNMLKLYAQVCCHHLAPHLSQMPMDRSLLDPLEGNQSSRSALDRSLPSPMPPPSTPESQGPDKAPSTPKSEHDGEGYSGRDMLLCGDGSHEDDSQEPPAVVVYLVDPFTIGSDSTDLQRLACLGLLRCFSTVLAGLPEHVRANICVQIISLESIIELGMLRDLHRYNDHIRAQAFSVFSQCRRMLAHTSNIKSLTGFGTAAMTDLFLKTKDEKNRAPYRLYTPPYVLAPVKEKNESSESFGQLSTEHCSVLYVSYCLSEDQHWLLAVATDDRGEILETAVINIDIPNRSRRKKASARRIGLQKLMDFVLGVMSQSVQPWRLVVGRIGRVGHGELKGWSVLLSRKALLKASKQLKEICSQCSLMYPSGVPCVLSACLVSLEPDTMLRLMSDQFTPDERFSQASLNCQLSTPQDVSCTHILVFPTSATTQSSQTAFQDQHINGPEFGDELFPSLNDDMPEGIEEMPMDLNDIFTWPETGLGGVQSPSGSPRRDSPSQPGSPSCNLGVMDQHSPSFPCNGNSRSGGSLGVDSQDEVGLLHQQPLALGFYVSTAPTGRMPRWFWASCPHLEDVCPAFLKNALLLHIPAIHQNDDLLQQQSAVAGHPLDSQYTTDVLRYVLEGYNALSWLALDANTHDRLSCLPVHVQALMQLYHMTSALV